MITRCRLRQRGRRRVAGQKHPGGVEHLVAGLTSRRRRPRRAGRPRSPAPGDVAHVLDRDRELGTRHPVRRGGDGCGDREERTAEDQRRVVVVGDARDLASSGGAAQTFGPPGTPVRWAARALGAPGVPGVPGVPGAPGARALMTTVTTSQPFTLAASAGSTRQISRPGPPLMGRSRRPSTECRRSAPRPPDSRSRPG